METIETFKLVYQRFIESNLTVKAFCKSENIPESRFFYWQSRIRKCAARQNSDFLPVSINNHSGKVVLVGGHDMGASGTSGQLRSLQPACEITFPNGVTVRLSGEVPVSTIGQLIMLGR